VCSRPFSAGTIARPGIRDLPSAALTPRVRHSSKNEEE
jgi:hypothetical protein